MRIIMKNPSFLRFHLLGGQELLSLLAPAPPPTRLLLFAENFRETTTTSSSRSCRDNFSIGSALVVVNAFVPNVIIPQQQQRRRSYSPEYVIGLFPPPQAPVDLNSLVKLNAKTPSDEEEEEEDGENIEEEEEDNDTNMSSFMESFRQAANTKLGTPIPLDNEFVESSSQKAQNDFLQAMQEAKQSMKEAKKLTGGNIDKAIDIVMNDIQKQEDFIEGLEQQQDTRGNGQEETENDNIDKNGDPKDDTSSFQ